LTAGFSFLTCRCLKGRMDKRIVFILAAVLFSLQLTFAQPASVKYLTGRSENGQPHLFWFGAGAAESSLYYDDGTAEWPVFVSGQWADNQILLRFSCNAPFYVVKELSALVMPDQLSDTASQFALSVKKDTGASPPGPPLSFDTMVVQWSGQNSVWAKKANNVLFVGDSSFWGALHWFVENPTNPRIGEDRSDTSGRNYVGFSGSFSPWSGGKRMIRAKVLANNPPMEDADSFWVYRGSDSSLVSHIATINSGKFDYFDVPQSGGDYFYRVTRWESDVESQPSNAHLLTASGTGINLHENEKSVFLLSEPFPNPFSSNVLFTARTDRQMEVGFSIYNLLGQKVYSKPTSHYSAGEHSFLWNGKDERGQILPSGLYFLRFRAGEEVFFKKVTLLR